MKTEYTGETFCCPKCGGSRYSSRSFGNPIIRTCYGNNVDDTHYRPCGFQWPNTDDWKYSKFGIFAIPENQLEHRLLENIGASVSQDDMNALAVDMAALVEKYRNKT